MIKRTLFFGNPYHLSTRLDQLLITHRDTGEEKSAPIEDIGFIVLEHPHITISTTAVQRLTANNTAVVFCDEKYLPSSLLFPLEGHQLQNERFRAQVNATEPLKKQLWQQTIVHKINNQAAMLEHIGQSGQALRYLAQQVKSGDSGNEEAQAARRYWPEVFGQNFKRERFGDAPNALLNYGYTIIRAAVARALTGSGLLPTLGIHHHNRYNAYCLADDIMEPLRPLVDHHVWLRWKENPTLNELDKEEKAGLLALLSADVVIDKQRKPLMVALSSVTSSLAACFEGTTKKIKYPQLVF